MPTPHRAREPLPLWWFIIWLIANSVGGNEALELDPVNFWAATLILAVAIDLNRPRPELGRDKA
jgi:hypothetical protein